MSPNRTTRAIFFDVGELYWPVATAPFHGKSTNKAQHCCDSIISLDTGSDNREGLETGPRDGNDSRVCVDFRCHREEGS